MNLTLIEKLLKIFTEPLASKIKTIHFATDVYRISRNSNHNFEVLCLFKPPCYPFPKYKPLKCTPVLSTSCCANNDLERLIKNKEKLK